MSDQKLRIEIESAATGQGVQQTAAGLQQVVGAANQAAPAMGKVASESKSTAAELGRGVEIGNAAVATLQNIASSSGGGAAGLIAIARAGFSAGTMFKGLLASLGPFGIAAAAVGIAVGLISAALRKSEEAAEKARAEIDKLNKQKLDEAVKEQERLKQAAEDTYRALKAEAAAKEEIADAELSRRKAETLANAKATGESTDVTEQKLRALERQREDEKRAAAINLANDEALARERNQIELQEQAKKAAEELAGAEARVAEVAAAEKAKQAAKDALDAETFKNVGRPAGAIEAIDPKIAEAYGAASARAAAAAKAAVGDDADQIGRLKAAAEDRKKDAEAAARAAALAYEDLDRLRRTQAATNPKIADTRQFEDAAARGQTPKQKADLDAEVSRLRGKWKSQIDAQVAQGVYTNEAAYAQAYGAGEWAKVRRMPGVAGPGTPNGPMTPDTVGGPSAPAPIQPAGLGAVPAGTPLPGAQDPRITRGGAVVDALKGATDATQSAPTGEAEAKAAEALKSATEQSAQAQQQSGEAIVQALDASAAAQAAAAQATVAAQQAALAKLQEVVAAQNALRAQMQQMAAQARAQRVT